MSKIEELIERLCPNGVEYKSLNEVFKQFSGMTGVSNKWKETGNCKFIDYMNAYKNLKIDVNRLENATVKKLEQNKLEKGDILLTSASETPDECAISSVIENNIADNIFMDDHLFGIRLKDEYKKCINTTYINYYMHTNSFRKDVFKAVRGVTRFYISVDAFMNIKVAVPPLEVQCEIVHILDDFTLLSAELSAELKAREKQYNFYKDKIFNISNETDYVEIKDVLQAKGYIRGPFGSALRKSDMVEHGVPVYEQQHAIYNHREFRYFISDEKAKSLSRFIVKDGDIILSCSGTVGRTSIIKQTDEKGVINQALLILRVDSDKINVRFLEHFLNSSYGRKKILSNTNGSAQVNICKREEFEKIKIPLPTIDEQNKIVSILDRFDKLCTDISEGLPAEIDARQKQYEYYRDKLLTFKELKVNEG